VAGDAIQQVYLAATQTKGREAQVVYFNKRLREAVRAYVSSKSLKRSQALIGSQKGGKFSSSTVQQLFRVLYREAGVSNASSHSGRRTFITTLSEKGVSARVIQALARHADLATTARYIDVGSDKLAAAVELA
jgi:integrase/recombinase XerD